MSKERIAMCDKCDHVHDLLSGCDAIDRVLKLEEDNRKLRSALGHADAALDDFGGVTELVTALEDLIADHPGNLHPYPQEPGTLKRAKQALTKHKEG